MNGNLRQQTGSIITWLHSSTHIGGSDINCSIAVTDDQPASTREPAGVLPLLINCHLPQTPSTDKGQNSTYRTQLNCYISVTCEFDAIGSESCRFVWNYTNGPFKVTQGHRFWYRSKTDTWLPVSEQVTWLVVTEVPRGSYGLVTERCHYDAYYVTLYYVSDVIFMIVECGIARFLSATRVFDVRASSSSLGYPCAKFRFCRGLGCWASLCRKIPYSINQSLTNSPSLFDAPGTEAFASE